MPAVIESIRSEAEDEESDLAPYKIVSYPADFTLQVLHEKWKTNEIIIPRFQRQYVWTLSQASRLIESFLLGLPVPGIFFYKDKETQRLLVVDGQQRLKSIFGFFEGQFPDSQQPFALRAVHPEWDGRSYQGLSEAYQIRLRDSVLRATIIDQLDPSDNSSVFHIFERLNTGGTILKPQEVRNCIYQGPFNDLLIELNGNAAWRELFGAQQPDRRMRDVELILRFLALFESGDQYAKPMKDFLSSFMRTFKDAKPAKLKQFEQLFLTTTQRVTTTLGEKPFNIRAGLNAAVFDSVMVAFASHSDTASDIAKRYKKLLSNDAYQAYVSTGTTDVDVVKNRIKLASAVLFRGE